MNGEAIFWPMLVQMLLTFAIYGLVSLRRIGAIKSGQAKASDYRIPSIEPEPSATAARSLINQFELPVLFYAACLVLFVLGPQVRSPFSLPGCLRWSRIAHAYVHVTTNRLRYRRPLFIASFFIALALCGIDCGAPYRGLIAAGLATYQPSLICFRVVGDMIRRD